jgi:hypothetical protein
MNLFSRSNQKGAPSEMASDVNTQPKRCHSSCCPNDPPYQFSCRSVGEFQPIGNPKLLISHWAFFNLHSGVSSPASHASFQQGVGDASGVGFAAALAGVAAVGLSTGVEEAVGAGEGDDVGLEVGLDFGLG